MSFKRLFERSLDAAPGRLHFAAHSHHLWPDASYDGHVECWMDAARLADRKWDRVMGEIWPAAQAAVAVELGTGKPDAIVFSSNTHDFIVRLAAACPRSNGKLKVLTSDGEFHSARRQFARWREEGWFEPEILPAEPFDDFRARFLERAASGEHNLIFVSQVMFNSGQLLGALDELAALARPEGPWVVIDGYHAFMAIDAPLSPAIGDRLFYLGGGYKYAMAGEGMAFLHCPPGFGPRPPITGWYAEFEDLTLPPGMIGYAPDATRFMGATFDPSALYRFTAVRRALSKEGLTTVIVSRMVAELQHRFLQAIEGSSLGSVELLNPLTDGPHARFLAFRTPNAQRWCGELMERDCITDVRGNVLRIGFGLYQDEADVVALADLVRDLA